VNPANYYLFMDQSGDSVASQSNKWYFNNSFQYWPHQTYLDCDFIWKIFAWNSISASKRWATFNCRDAIFAALMFYLCFNFEQNLDFRPR